MGILRNIFEAQIPRDRRKEQEEWKLRQQQIRSGSGNTDAGVREETKENKPRKKLIETTGLLTRILIQIKETGDPQQQLTLAKQTLQNIANIKKTIGRIKFTGEDKYFEQLERLKQELVELIAQLKNPAHQTETRASREIEGDHSLVLPHLDLRFLQSVLETTSSGDGDCVPITSFYLAILATGEKNPEKIKILKEKVDNTTGRERSQRGLARSGWLDPEHFTETLFDELNIDRPSSIFDITFGFPPGTDWKDSLSTKFLAVVDNWLNKGWFRSDTYSDPINKIVEEGHEFAELPAFSIKTKGGIEGEIVFLPENNPYFQQYPELTPHNNRWRTAGEHNIVLLDYSISGDRGYGYFLDPMSGIIIKYPLESILQQMDLSPDNQNKLMPLRGVGANMSLFRQN
ncbi:MAG: hypothetical protein U9O78_01125 [Patescibacteria group bacterium]|nr:hypothetical protein [Patescibacteria group bacterium]